MYFNNTINFSNAKIFSKQIKQNGINCLNYVHNLEPLSVANYLTSDYSIVLTQSKNYIDASEIEEAAVYDKTKTIDSEDILTKQLQLLESLKCKMHNASKPFFNQTKSKSAFKIKSSLPTDQSSRLLRRLVNATGQFEVTQVFSSANRSLIIMRMAITFCDNAQQSGSLRGAIKKLEKIINRCEIKSKQLKEEEEIRLKSKNAEKNKQKKLKDELENKLNERIRKRKVIESAWLREISYGTLHKKLIFKNNKCKDRDNQDKCEAPELTDISLELNEELSNLQFDMPAEIDIQSDNQYNQTIIEGTFSTFSVSNSQDFTAPSIGGEN